MMTLSRAIDILETERECVSRNNGINCDRKCADCDLALDPNEILNAYDLVVALLRNLDHQQKSNKRFVSVLSLIACYIPTGIFTSAICFCLSKGFLVASGIFGLLLFITLPTFKR